MYHSIKTSPVPPDTGSGPPSKTMAATAPGGRQRHPGGSHQSMGQSTSSAQQQSFAGGQPPHASSFAAGFGASKGSGKGQYSVHNGPAGKKGGFFPGGTGKGFGKQVGGKAQFLAHAGGKGGEFFQKYSVDDLLGQPNVPASLRQVTKPQEWDAAQILRTEVPVDVQKSLAALRDAMKDSY
jgi:hypothetical protein